MSAEVFEYEEDSSGVMSDGCFISNDIGAFYEATANVLPWAPAYNGDPSKARIENMYLEETVQNAPIDPTALPGLEHRGFMQACLGVQRTGELINLMVDKGMLKVATLPDGTIEPFESKTTLFQEAKKAMEACINDPGCDAIIKEHDFDWYEAFAGGAATASLQWLHDYPLAKLLRAEKTLQMYVELSLLLGHRATETVRANPMSQVRQIGGQQATGNGQLLTTLCSYFNLQPTMGAFMVATRMPEFFMTTRWPEPYSNAFMTSTEYGLDVTARARWPTATRAEWPALISNKIVEAVAQLTPLQHALHSVMHSPTELMSYIIQMGDAILPGEVSQKIPLRRVTEINQYLKDCQGVIDAGVASGFDTQRIASELLMVMVPKSTSAAPAGDSVTTTEGEIVPPKRGQIFRARAQSAGFVALSNKWLPILKEPGQPKKDKMQLITECFKESSMMAKAVLFNCPGCRLAVYFEDEFLLLLAEERSGLGLYFGQSVAYDDEDSEVPEECRTFVYPPAQLALFTAFRWTEMDPLHGCILPLATTEVGADFATHDLEKLYEYAEMIALVRDIWGKLFLATGYPRKVPSDIGLSFVDFMNKIKKLQKTTLGMQPVEAEGMFSRIKDYVRRGMQAAQMHAKQQFYGGNVLGQQLLAWIPADEVVLEELDNELEAVKDLGKWRKRLAGMHGVKPVARVIPGLETPKATIPKEEGGKGKGPPKKPKEKLESGGGKGKGKGGGKGEGKGGKKTEEKTHDGKETNGVFYYDDGTFSKCQFLVHWPAICHKLGIDKNKYCGPCTMSLRKGGNNELDCGDSTHKKGCAAHTTPKYEGKDFNPKDHQQAFRDEGLVTTPNELKAMKKTKEGDFSKHKPQGKAVKQGGKLVYPSAHFA